MEWIARAADKAGALGTLLSAAACPACLPALASLGAAAGLGIFSGYEGLFMGTLLPLFATIALLANALGWFSHRRWQQSLLGMAGPALVLAALWFFFGETWGSTLLYAGLAGMVGVSLWDLFSPAHRRCSRCEVQEARP